MEGKGFIIQGSSRLHDYRKWAKRLLLNDTGDQTSGDGTATLTDVEALAGLGSDGVVGLQDHLDIVTGHDALGQITVREAEIAGLI
jgi:hypothetical protein